MDDYIFEVGGPELLDRIAGLWQELNHLHAGLSCHFGDEIAGRAFDGRKAELLEKAERGQLRVEICVHQSRREPVGYCVSSVEGKQGEVDSIYLQFAHRGHGLGGQLLASALRWLESEGAERVTAEVLVGNEKVFDFYARHGLLPRRTIMMTKLR